MSAVYKVITNDTNIPQIHFDCNGNTVELQPGESKNICVGVESNPFNIKKFEDLCAEVKSSLEAVQGIAGVFAPDVLSKLDELLNNVKPPKPPK